MLVLVTCIAVAGVPMGPVAAAPVEQYETVLGEVFTQDNCWSGLSAKSMVTLEVKQGNKWVAVSKTKPTKSGVAGGCTVKYPWSSVNSFQPKQAGVIRLRVSAGNGKVWPFNLTVIAQKALNASAGDLSAFVTAHGGPVVSVTCAGVTVSGVVMFATSAPEAINAGMRSNIATSQYGLDPCLSGSWLDRRVSVRAGAVEYIGYIWTWGDDSDIAVITTSADLPSVPSLFSEQAPRPSAGDTSVLIWGQNGAAGRADAGVVAISESDFIFTTNRAPDTHLAGSAVFNVRGDLIGIVDGQSLDSDSRTLYVLPITRFCGNVYATSCYIAWGK